MTKKQTKKIISKYLPLFIDHLSLWDWDISIEFCDQDLDGEVAGDNTINISYLRSAIRFYPVLYESNEQGVKQTLMHELCHIITEPQYSLCRANVPPQLYAFVEEQREQETERIARIALKSFSKS